MSSSRRSRSSCQALTWILFSSSSRSKGELFDSATNAVRSEAGERLQHLLDALRGGRHPRRFDDPALALAHQHHGQAHASDLDFRDFGKAASAATSGSV